MSLQQPPVVVKAVPHPLPPSNRFHHQIKSQPINQATLTVRNRSRNYRWLQYDTSKKVETCKNCTDRGRKNAFTRGSYNFKTSNMEYHQQSNDHQTAMLAPVLERDMENAEKNVHSESEKGILVTLETANLLASDGIALIEIKILYPVLQKNESC